ncbi:LacI family DNA-binding transcriptional regulator [Leifsonia sp. NPDC058230]|uniref:LacI family DNA-binding transcriptional regulator n=1 Tax=Leifsonia sp. NPDC058230 TaxID=3346391 RepID=UPI0036DE4F79
MRRRSRDDQWKAVPMPSVSVRDVAALAGVSVGTVSNVLNRPEKVAEHTVEKVHGAIEKLGFVRNDAARQLRAGRSRAVGLIILDVGNPFFTDLARGAEAKAAAEGLSIILGNSDEKAERESAYLDLFEEQRMHGVLVSPFGDIIPRLRRLRERGIPAVLVDRTSVDSTFSSVSVDDEAGGELAAAHLLATGRRRIAYVGGPSEIRQVVDRLEGARRAVAAHPGATLEVVPVGALTVAEGREAGQALAARPADARPDGIFAANDLLAMGLLQAMEQASMHVPDEVGLIGYDDIGFASAAVVPLSSIHQPSMLIGETAVQILLEEAADPALPPRHIVYQPELVVRQSTGAGVTAAL